MIFLKSHLNYTSTFFPCKPFRAIRPNEYCYFLIEICGSSWLSSCSCFFQLMGATAGPWAGWKTWKMDSYGWSAYLPQTLPPGKKALSCQFSCRLYYFFFFIGPYYGLINSYYGLINPYFWGRYGRGVVGWPAIVKSWLGLAFALVKRYMNIIKTVYTPWKSLASSFSY